MGHLIKNTIILFSYLLSISSIVHSAVIHVPADSATIQAGIDGASEYDTVLVAAGEYSGDGNRNLIMDGKSIVLKSESGAENTTINCGLSCGLEINNFDTFTTVDGFSIINGLSYSESVVEITGAPRIKDCIFRNNTCLPPANGGAVFCHYGAPRFTGCIFEDNEALDIFPYYGSRFGGGVFCLSSEVTFERCTFINNRSNLGGAILNFSGNITVKECLFAGNSATEFGGGIYSQDSVLIIKCTFFGNRAANGAAMYLRYSSVSVVDHCLIAYNPEGCSVDIGSTTTSCIVRCSDIFGNPDGDYVGALAGFYGIDGNTAANPLFCDTAAGYFSIAANSPCAADNSECNELIGAFDVKCDPVGINENYPDHVLPAGYSLSQNYPNPFNPATKIEFGLPRSAHAEVNIYEISGRHLTTLLNCQMNPGSHTVEWDGTDSEGRQVASGIYLYQLRAGDFLDSKKMILLK